MLLIDDVKVIHEKKIMEEEKARRKDIPSLIPK